MERPDEARSRIMRAVKSKDTGPEMAVRRLLHGLGFRYRLHRADLPGKPDLAFPARRKAVFVHGCFWHGHECRRGARAPKANAEYWRAKIQRNQARDATTVERMSALGWQTTTVWECETRPREKDALADRLSTFLGQP